MIELEEILTNGRKSIWGLRLHSLQTVWIVDPRYSELCKKFDFEAEKDPLGLWLTLRLIWGHGGMATVHSYVDMVNLCSGHMNQCPNFGGRMIWRKELASSRKD